MAPRYRIDHIGSLIRPESLIEARNPIIEAQYKQAPVSSEQQQKLDSTVGKSIENVVKEQVDRKILPITTGEFERQYFFDGFFESLEGTENRFTSWDQFRPEMPQNKPLMERGWKGRPAIVATSKIRRARPAYLDDWLLFRNCLPKDRWRDAKMTMPSPAFAHIQLNEPYTKESGYTNDEDYLADIATALREEILELYEHGLRNVQIDDPNLTFFCFQSWMDTLKEHNVDTDRLLDLEIRAHALATKELPSDLHIGIHLCRGNYPNGIYIASGGYEDIAQKLFKETGYHTFYLEFDSPRAGDFGPLKHLPQGKNVVLGMVTTKSCEMEDLAELKERVLAAADVIAGGQGVTREKALQESLAVSPQCGFSSDHSGKGLGMTIEGQWSKLELLQRLAEELWPGWETKLNS